MLRSWSNGITVLYVLWFLCGYILITGDLLPAWLEWANSFYLILGGVTAGIWYIGRYGVRQALILIVVCASISYTAEWIGVHTGRWFGSYSYGPSFAPLVFGVPLAIPFAWIMLLVIAKAFAPVKAGRKLWKGLTVQQALSPDKESLLRSRRRARRRHFWLPAVWAAIMVTSMDLLLDPVASQKRYWSWAAPDHGTPTLPDFYSVPLSNFVCWLVTALLIINIINFLHDEYFDREAGRSSAYGPFIPWLLLLTLESLFLTLALRTGLWWAAGANVALLSILFLWKRKEEAA
ncbi:carotenoid biosynthesis protein [Paenibacillus silviterrae]|uniref:carotenoid biosynthesis protein n=1 Tax=Paenibacillus silviterrae TaxID=3242194 RepID=UPI0025432F4F|nr:carotenoid biosynthesis protein [Paenibacillus chinjuensis]